MSSSPPASKTAQQSPWEHVCDNVAWMLSEAECLTPDQVEVLGSELSLMESEAEYNAGTHSLQGRDATAIDLSTSTEEHSPLMLGEKTPMCCTEVPAHVMERSQSSKSPAGCGRNPLRAFGSSARVRLDTRFNSVCADAPTPQETQPAALNTYLTMLQHTTLAQDAAPQPQMQRFMKTEPGNPFGVPHPDVGCVYTPLTTLSDKVTEYFPSVGESLRNQRATSSYVATPAAPRKPRCIGSACLDREAPDSGGGAKSATQRKDQHNRLERERRKRIRLYCNELKSLVPFCDASTDKATTLKWTTAFLGYIAKTYGDTFRKEFQEGYFDGCKLSSAHPKMK